jgi:hypothetical protein
MKSKALSFLSFHVLHARSGSEPWRSQQYEVAVIAMREQ